MVVFGKVSMAFFVDLFLSVDVVEEEVGAVLIVFDCSNLTRGSGMMPCTEEGPERETSVRASSPIKPWVPPP